jgi:hypothetical protein
MAISPEHPGLEVKICVHGQQLPEYDDDDEDPTPKTTTKYMEARSDDHFSIVTKFGPPFPAEHHVQGKISIDGVYMAKWFFKREELFDKTFEGGSIRWQKDGEWVKQGFSFAKLNIGKYCRRDLLLYTDGLAQSKRLVNLFLMLLI